MNPLIVAILFFVGLFFIGFYSIRQYSKNMLEEKGKQVHEKENEYKNLLKYYYNIKNSNRIQIYQIEDSIEKMDEPSFGILSFLFLGITGFISHLITKEIKEAEYCINNCKLYIHSDFTINTDLIGNGKLVVALYKGKLYLIKHNDKELIVPKIEETRKLNLNDIFLIPANNYKTVFYFILIFTLTVNWIGGNGSNSLILLIILIISSLFYWFSIFSSKKNYYISIITGKYNNGFINDIEVLVDDQLLEKYDNEICKFEVILNKNKKSQQNPIITIIGKETFKPKKTKLYVWNLVRIFIILLLLTTYVNKDLPLMKNLNNYFKTRNQIVTIKSLADLKNLNNSSPRVELKLKNVYPVYRFNKLDYYLVFDKAPKIPSLNTKRIESIYKMLEYFKENKGEHTEKSFKKYDYLEETNMYYLEYKTSVLNWDYYYDNDYKDTNLKTEELEFFHNQLEKYTDEFIKINSSRLIAKIHIDSHKFEFLKYNNFWFDRSFKSNLTKYKEEYLMKHNINIDDDNRLTLKNIDGMKIIEIEKANYDVIYKFISKIWFLLGIILVLIIELILIYKKIEINKKSHCNYNQNKLKEA